MYALPFFEYWKGWLMPEQSAALDCFRENYLFIAFVQPIFCFE